MSSVASRVAIMMNMDLSARSFPGQILVCTSKHQIEGRNEVDPYRLPNPNAQVERSSVGQSRSRNRSGMNCFGGYLGLGPIARHL